MASVHRKPAFIASRQCLPENASPSTLPAARCFPFALHNRSDMVLFWLPRIIPQPNDGLILVMVVAKDAHGRGLKI